MAYTPRHSESGPVTAASSTSEQRAVSAGMTSKPTSDSPGRRRPSATVASPAKSSLPTSPRQVAFMRERYPDAEIVSDVGSGLNFKRRGLLAILERLHQGDKLRVVVAYRDRLARFGTELIETLLERNGGELVVLNQRDLSPEEELTTDLLAILTVFGARVNGLRRYRKEIAQDKALPGRQPEG